MGTPAPSIGRSAKTPSGSVAVALAVLPASGPEPRVIQQYQSTFLVDRHGDIWRVYDGNEIDGGERHMPSVSPCSFRMFIPLARNAAMRVHSFARDSAREVDPVSLQAQLDGSRPN